LPEESRPKTLLSVAHVARLLHTFRSPDDPHRSRPDLHRGVLTGHLQSVQEAHVRFVCGFWGLPDRFPVTHQLGRKSGVLGQGCQETVVEPDRLDATRPITGRRRHCPSAVQRDRD
jgi:hypothetical protein